MCAQRCHAAHRLPPKPTHVFGAAARDRFVLNCGPSPSYGSCACGDCPFRRAVLQRFSAWPNVRKARKRCAWDTERRAELPPSWHASQRGVLLDKCLSLLCLPPTFGVRSRPLLTRCHHFARGVADMAAGGLYRPDSATRSHPIKRSAASQPTGPTTPASDMTRSPSVEPTPASRHGSTPTLNRHDGQGDGAQRRPSLGYGLT